MFAKALLCSVGHWRDGCDDFLQVILLFYTTKAITCKTLLDELTGSETYVICVPMCPALEGAKVSGVMPMLRTST